MTTLVWFRRDLRLADNPALFHAAHNGPILPVYILDEPHNCPMGAASRWWLHHSLAALKRTLPGLVLLRGDSRLVLRRLIGEVGAHSLHWNRSTEPRALARDTEIMADFKAEGIHVRSFNGALLHEPWEVKTGAGGPFKVYTPYWRAARQLPEQAPLPAPETINCTDQVEQLTLADLHLLPRAPDWATHWLDHWAPGETGAATRLEDFLDSGLSGYATLRDRPDLDHVSRLSPHLHFGEISPRQIFRRIAFLRDQMPTLSNDAEKFLSELGWREFSHHLLFHFPDLPRENWKPAFDKFPWSNNVGHLQAWQRGMTGYPIVDAGMRELWATGTMHNRVRMIAASFLVKHLRIDWRKGAAWFLDTLVDADLANNSAGWQWVSGSGADASPFFRIFNPMIQGRKCDPEGSYVRRWCPELARLDTSLIHAPFEADEQILKKADVVLGKTYPLPLVNHAEARAAALAAYEKVRNAAKSAVD